MISKNSSSTGDLLNFDCDTSSSSQHHSSKKEEEKSSIGDEFSLLSVGSNSYSYNNSGSNSSSSNSTGLGTINNSMQNQSSNHTSSLNKSSNNNNNLLDTETTSPFSAMLNPVVSGPIQPPSNTSTSVFKLPPPPGSFETKNL